MKLQFGAWADGLSQKSLTHNIGSASALPIISGYPDVRDPDIFGAFTRVGAKRFRRLHVSRHPDVLYAAYSLCVGEILSTTLYNIDPSDSVSVTLTDKEASVLPSLSVESEITCVEMILQLSTRASFEPLFLFCCFCPW